LGADFSTKGASGGLNGNWRHVLMPQAWDNDGADQGRKGEESRMPTRMINKGKHSYRIETTALADGWYTFEIVHIERTGNVTKEIRHKLGIAYASEEIAMDNGLHAAAEMAERVKD
jgi:hypothetical protein